MTAHAWVTVTSIERIRIDDDGGVPRRGPEIVMSCASQNGGATVMVVGGTGQVGSALSRALADAELPVRVFDRQSVDVTDPSVLRAALDACQPEILVNAAAFTAVDLAEGDRESARALNAAAVGDMARACSERRVAFVTYSTDYVFSGDSDRAYTESDPRDPINVYGETKAEGEVLALAELERVLILRTSWIFSPIRNNFVLTMLRHAMQGNHLRVVVDELGNPTAASDVAAVTVTLIGRMLQSDPFRWGIYHFGGAPVVSRFGLAQAVLESAERHGDVTTTIEAIPSRDYPTPARRPRRAVLDCSRLRETFGIAQPDWCVAVDAVVKQALEQAVAEVNR